MLPGISSRQARRLLQKLGLQMKEFEGVKEVILRMEDGRELVVESPLVYQLASKDLSMLNIIGKLVERKATAEEEISLSEEDVELIMQQTGASRDEAIQALIESGGDLAEAILKLQERGAGKR